MHLVDYPIIETVEVRRVDIVVRLWLPACMLHLRLIRSLYLSCLRCITQGIVRLCMKETGIPFSITAPVLCTSWYEIDVFCIGSESRHLIRHGDSPADLTRFGM